MRSPSLIIADQVEEKEEEEKKKKKEKMKKQQGFGFNLESKKIQYYY